MTSREFNQDTARAKRAAEDGPVYVTDRGRPSHVLLSWEAYERLLAPGTLLDLLAEPPGVEDVGLPTPRHRDRARRAPID
jgi:prevent-host-death family protein